MSNAKRGALYPWSSATRAGERVSIVGAKMYDLLAIDGKLTNKGLAAALEVSAVRAKQVVVELEHKGLIERTILEGNKRIIRILK